MYNAWLGFHYSSIKVLLWCADYVATVGLLMLHFASSCRRTATLQLLVKEFGTRKGGGTCHENDFETALNTMSSNHFIFTSLSSRLVRTESLRRTNWELKWQHRHELNMRRFAKGGVSSLPRSASDTYPDDVGEVATLELTLQLQPPARTIRGAMGSATTPSEPFVQNKAASGAMSIYRSVIG